KRFQDRNRLGNRELGRDPAERRLDGGDARRCEAEFSGHDFGRMLLLSGITSSGGKLQSPAPMEHVRARNAAKRSCWWRGARGFDRMRNHSAMKTLLLPI